MSKPKIFKLFLDVHMGQGHQGLALLAQKEKINLASMGTTDLLLFINRKGDKMKVLGAQGRVVGYLKMPRGQPIMRGALRYIPATFGAEGFNYDDACKMALQKRLNLLVL